MKKFLRKVIKNFKKFADAKFLTFAQNVVTSVGNAAAVYPAPTPAIATIATELGNYAALLQTAASKDKVQVKLKNQSKAALIAMLSQLADYVNLTTSDPAELEMSGYFLNKIPEPVKLKAPAGLMLTDGNNSGELSLTFPTVKGAASYLFQYTSDSLLGNNSWQSFPATTTSYTFTGLAKATTYYCRSVAVGANGQVMNSMVVNRVSQ